MPYRLSTNMTAGPEPIERRPGGLEAVYLAHRETLLRFLRARGAGDAAEDLVQELWLKVSSAPATPIADPLSYLYRAANNLMISRHRSAVSRGARDERWAGAGDEADAGGEAALAARQELERAEQRLRALGPRVLRIFLLFRVDGVPQRAIAEQLSISLSAVEKDLQRAYRAMADLRSEIDAG
jgi:RNA polymerase sigma-70 factor (ECF subfamily)